MPMPFFLRADRILKLYQCGGIFFEHRCLPQIFFAASNQWHDHMGTVRSPTARCANFIDWEWFRLHAMPWQEEMAGAVGQDIFR